LACSPPISTAISIAEVLFGSDDDRSNPLHFVAMTMALRLASQMEHRRHERVRSIGLKGRSAMDWNRIEGNQLEGRLQKRYGYAKDQAKKDVDSWFSTLK
jgi:hypothetical protein